MIDAENDFCPECGFTFGKGEGSDTEVYQDLAQANLSRMRGDKQGAIDQCLKVLRAFPNNVTAHSLLGEIYMEHGELTQAKEWLEMALDLDPSSEREKQLLKKISQELENKDHKIAVEQLEVRPQSGLTALWVVMMALILVVGGLSFFVGRNAGQKSEVATVEQTPAEPIRMPATEEPVSENPVVDATPAPNGPTGVAPLDDADAVKAIFEKAQKGALIQTVFLNPATEQVIVTAMTEPGVQFETSALLLAGDVFVGRPSTRSAVLRLVSAGRVVFVGEVTREAYDEAEAMSQGTPIDELAIRAFLQAWHRDASTRPGSAVKPPDTSE